MTQISADVLIGNTFNPQMAQISAEVLIGKSRDLQTNAVISAAMADKRLVFNLRESVKSVDENNHE